MNLGYKLEIVVFNGYTFTYRIYYAIVLKLGGAMDTGITNKM